MKCFGYPLINNKEFQPDFYGNMANPRNKSFENDINQKVILMDLYYKNKAKYYPDKDFPEVQICIIKGRGNIKIKIKKNETLIKEREEKIKKNNFTLIYKNILVIFIDTLSRAHFHRKFHKTIKFLEQFTKYEPNASYGNFSIFQI